MKIWLYYEPTTKPWGGINTFFKSFRDFVQEKKESIQIVDSIESNPDIILIGAASKGVDQEITVKEIQNLLKSRSRLFNKILSRKQFILIHRLDGLRAYYGDKRLPSDDVQVELSKLADFIVFQSKSSLNTFKKEGYEGTGYQIIFNGVNQEIFKFKKREIAKNKKITVVSSSWSNHINKGFETISKLSLLDNVNIEFVGRWNDDVPINNVLLHGPKEALEIAKILNGADIFLHAAKNDPCPNVVLEALSSGLPIFYNNSGGTKELAMNYGVPIPEKVNSQNLESSLMELVDSYDSIVEKIHKDIHEFSIERVVEDYVNVFKDIQNKY